MIEDQLNYQSIKCSNLYQKIITHLFVSKLANECITKWALKVTTCARFESYSCAVKVACIWNGVPTAESGPALTERNK